MGYARHIGRVGALAVALGIGGAVANGSGIASATPESDGAGIESPASPDQHQADSASDGPKLSTKPVRPRVVIAGVREAVEGARDALASLGETPVSITARKRPAFHGRSRDDQASETAKSSSAKITAHEDSSGHAVALPRRTTTSTIDTTILRARDDKKTSIADTAHAIVSPAAGSLPSWRVDRQSIANLSVTDAPDTRARTVNEQPIARATIAVARPLPRLLSIFGLSGLLGGGGESPENPLAAAVLGFARRLDRAFDNKTPVTDFHQGEIVQVDQDRAVGYLDPVDPDGGPLSYSYTTTKGGTVTFDESTPGEFTYHAPDEWTGTGEWTDTVTITTSDARGGWHLHGLQSLFEPDRGHTTTQTVSVVLEPTTEAVVHDDGTVRGAVPADNDTLSYTVGEQVDKSLGEITVDETTGEWTFTPTAQARLAAAGSGVQSVTFTVLAGDGEHQTPIALTAPISPVAGAPVQLPPGAVQAGSAVTGAGGSVVVTSNDPVKHETYLTVLGTDGTPRTSAPLPGDPVGVPVPGANGVLYQTTHLDGIDGGTTYLNVVQANGAVKSVTVPGDIEGNIVAGPPGFVYVASTVTAEPPEQPVAARAFAFSGARMSTMAAPADPDTAGVTTYLTVIGPDGTVYRSELPGRAVGDPTYGPDGTGYLTTSTYDSSPGGVGYQTHLAVLHPDGTAPVTLDFAGQAQPMVVDSNGTVFQTVYDSDAEQTVVYTLDGTGPATPHELLGSPIGDPVMGDNGTFYLTTNDYNDEDAVSESYIWTLRSGDALPGSVRLPGPYAYNGVVLNSDGVAYQASVDYASGQTFVTTIGSDGTPVSGAEQVIPGLPSGQPLVVAANGTGYIVTSPSDAEVTYVTIVDESGTVRTNDPIQGSPVYLGTYVAPDGTVFQTTYLWNNGYPKTFATVIGADNIQHTTALRGQPWPNSIVADNNGVVYQTTVDQDTRQTFVTAIHSDGTTSASYPLAGLPISDGLTVAPDGHVYQTTALYDAGTGTFQTYVESIGPDGSVRVSDPLTGNPASGVQVLPNGTVLQQTDTGLYQMDRSAWQVHRPPTPAPQAPSVTHADGSVSGQVIAADPDAQSVTYELAADVDPGVVLGPDGAWTFTPTGDQRNAAYYGSGPDEVTFVVVVTDGEFRVPVNVTAAIDPEPGTTIMLPAGASPRGAMIVGADGTAYQMSHNEATDKSYLTVLRTDGTAFTSDPMPGGTIDGPVAAPDGTVYQLTSDSVTGRSYINVVGPTGAVTSTELPGQTIYSSVAGPGGTLYLTTMTQDTAGGGLGGGLGGSGGAGGDGGGLGGPGGPGGGEQLPVDMYVTVVGPDGVHTSAPIPGRLQGPIAVDSAGFAYVTTRDGGQSYVAVVNPSGDLVREPQPLTGDAVGPAVPGPEGTVYQTTYDSADASTHVVTIRRDGTVQRGEALPASPISIPVVRPDGTAFQTTYDADHTYVSMIAPDGTVLSTRTFDGTTGYGPTVGADGTVYQTYYTGHPVPGDESHYEYQTSVVVFTPDGSQHLVPEITGQGNNGGVHFDDAGGAYLITDTQFSAVNKTYITKIDNSGNVVNSAELEGFPVHSSYHVGPDGALFMTTYNPVPSSADPQETYFNYIDAGGVVHQSVVHRAVDFNGGMVIDPNGTVYQLTTDTDTDRTYVTTVDTAGVVRNSDPVPGRPNGPALAVAPDGTVYLTTSENDHVVGKTYVTVVEPDGTVHVGEPIDGFSTGPVVFDSHQTAYQSTSVQTAVVTVG